MIETYLQTGEYSVNSYHQKGNVFGGKGSISVNQPVSYQIAAEGQTLFETEPESFTSGQLTVKTNTGEFFLEDYELKNTHNTYLGLTGVKNLIYDLATGQRYFGTGANMWSGISGLLPDYEHQIFLNGMKLISGQSYNNGDWTDIDITGTIFSEGYNFTDYYYGSGEYDISGVRFHDFNSYVNGMKMHENDFLITSSNVGIIETGLEPTIEFATTSTTINF